MMKKSLLARVVLGLFVALMTTFLSMETFAQGTTTAAMSGTVLDEKGEGLPGATVVAIHEPTGARYGASTRVDGRFNLVNMRVGGPYKVTVSFVGYKDAVKTGINLVLSQDYRFTQKLETADTQLEEVKVVSQRGAVINANRTGAATTVGNSQLTTLPTLNRSLRDFARLDPRANGLNFAGRNALYNNITVDGAYFNNAFGLQETIGAQANAQPVSIDAIDQIQINIAPYDVRQGLATGANINIVTKGGTNQWSGSGYYFNRNESLVGTKVADLTSPITTFSSTQYGGRLGGPIIRNKVFIFASFEQEDRTDPGSLFVANRPGLPAPGSGSTTSTPLAVDLDKLKSFLQSKYNYDPGAYEGWNRLTYNQKINVRLDFNLSEKHKLNFKYNYVRSFADIPPSNSGSLTGGRSPSSTVLPFQGSLYRINNNVDSYILELNSSFSSKVSNNFKAGYVQLRDFRQSPVNNTPFPTVDIGNNSTQELTTFGYEPFSANNLLDTDVLQISDDVTYYAGKHVLTFGAAIETKAFRNGFAPNFYGGYQFRSYDDFYASANGTATAAQIPIQYRLQWSNFANFPFAEYKGNTYSAYAQDEITLKSGLKLTFGLRADGVSSPINNSDSRYTNRYVPAFNFLDNTGVINVATDRLPDFNILWSPRFGFNWDIKDDKQTQIRGGAGIFTGAVPFVWLSNQLSNNGVLFGSITANNPTNRPFTADINAYRPAAVTEISTLKPTAYNLAITDPNFKFPQVFRANLAIDKQLGNGWLLTAEALYTKDLNAVYLTNINLPASPGNAIGPDNRPIWYTATTTTGGTRYNRIYGLLANGGKTAAADISATNPDISDAILLKNTNNGYSYALTGTIAKTFESGLFASLSYTYTDSRSVNDGGSIAQSQWSGRVVSGSPNADVTSYSSYLQAHRINAFGSYKFSYLNDKMSTTIGFGYSVAPAGRVSYIYSGDMNGDGLNANDLMYVPRDASDIVLRDLTVNGVVYSAAQQWNDLNTYISQDPYLKSRRGQYAERNGGELPWAANFDLKITQDFKIRVGKSTNTLQVSADIFNFGNYVSQYWGISQSAIRASLLNFVGFDTGTGTGNTGRPVFQFPFRDNTSRTALTESYQNNIGVGARWQVQVGLRYIFN